MKMIQFGVEGFLSLISTCLRQATGFRCSVSKLRSLLVWTSITLTMSGCTTLANNTNDQTFSDSGINTIATTQYELIANADKAYDIENWLLASVLYREAVEAVPSDTYAWFRMGNCLTQLGQYAQAVNAYESSLASDGTQFKAWFNLSTTHLLAAKVVTLNALSVTGMNGPSRNKLENRLEVLSALLN